MGRTEKLCEQMLVPVGESIFKKWTSATALEMVHFGGRCRPLSDRSKQHSQWEGFISKQLSVYHIVVEIPNIVAGG